MIYRYEVINDGSKTTLGHDLPCVDETISRDTLDCRLERELSRVFDPLLRRIEAKKSSLVAPAG